MISKVQVHKSGVRTTTSREGSAIAPEDAETGSSHLSVGEGDTPVKQ